MQGKVYKKNLEQGRQSDFIHIMGDTWYEKAVVYINEDEDAEDRFLTVVLSCLGCPLSSCGIRKKFSMTPSREILNIPIKCPLRKNEFALLEIERPSMSKTELSASLAAKGIYFVSLFNYYGDTPIYIVYSTRYSLQQIKEALVEILL